MYLYAFSLANPLKPFSCSLNVWDHNGDVHVGIVSGVVVSRVVVVVDVLTGLVASLEIVLELIKCKVGN